MYILLSLIAGLSLCYGDLTGMVTMNASNSQAMALDINPTGGTVQIVFTGKTEGWFGVGFNNTDMTATYTIIVDYTGIIYEYYLGSGKCSPGCDAKLEPYFYVNSNTISNGVRTINITRPVSDFDNGAMYYNFPTAAADIQLIWAWGKPQEVYQEATAMAKHGECKIKIS